MRKGANDGKFTQEGHACIRALAAPWEMPAGMPGMPVFRLDCWLSGRVLELHERHFQYPLMFVPVKAKPMTHRIK